MTFDRRTRTVLLAALLAPAAAAQDSVSKSGCLPGDAVPPWSDATAATGTEQVNDYVVDLADVFSSWGTRFGVAPLLKSGKTSSGFFSSLLNAQGISRKIAKKQPFAAPSYLAWTQPGFGVNGDPLLNDPGAATSAAGKSGIQFGVVMAETATTDAAVPYNGVVSALVNIDPEDTARLYVRRIQAAVNGCDSSSSMVAFGVGSVDEFGNVAVRTDSFGQLNQTCGGAFQLGNNVYLLDSTARDFSILNAVNGNYPTAFDVGATHWIVQDSPTTYNTPNLLPESMNGGTPLYLGLNFATQYARGSSSATLVEDATHLNGAFIDHRGNPTYLSKNFATLGSTHGLMAHLAVQTGTNGINVFGLGAGGAVTGSLAVTLPAVVVDNATGFANLGPGGNTFDHYKSQVAFQGGNGQVAVNLDPLGNLLLAAEVDQPIENNQASANYIAVCRVAPSGGVSWTMAGYNDGTAGKPILDGPGGSIIGQMVPLGAVDSTLPGPSVSAPMLDSAGNVWFLAPVQLFGDPNPFGYALLRAVYDPALFAYDLELVLRAGALFGTTIAGPNSGRNYRITNFRIADSNSVASNTCWSQNVSEEAFLGLAPASFAPQEPHSLGGLVLNASITYDRDGDGDFVVCTDPSGGSDEVYTVVLYLGCKESSGVLRYGTGCDGSLGIVPKLSLDGYPSGGSQVTLNVEKAVGPTSGLLFFGLGQGNAPVQGICKLLVAPLLPIIPAIPIFGSGPGNGFLSVPSVVPPTLPPGFTVTMQAFIVDPGVPRGFSNTNGLQVTFQ